MQIKRLLDDRVVVTGDKLINSQGEHCEFVEHADGQLVAVSLDGKKIRNSPAKLGCYLLGKNRTDRGLARDRLRSFWEDS
jgi:hypothetical protein